MFVFYVAFCIFWLKYARGGFWDWSVGVLEKVFEAWINDYSLMIRRSYFFKENDTASVDEGSDVVGAE